MGGIAYSAGHAAGESVFDDFSNDSHGGSVFYTILHFKRGSLFDGVTFERGLY